MTKKTEPTFEQSLARLEKIVSEMEEGRMGLDKMLAMFSEGMDLATFCNGKLEKAEKKVEILVKKHDGTISTEPFDSQESDETDEED